MIDIESRVSYIDAYDKLLKFAFENPQWTKDGRVINLLPETTLHIKSNPLVDIEELVNRIQFLGYHKLKLQNLDAVYYTEVMATLGQDGVMSIAKLDYPKWTLFNHAKPFCIESVQLSPNFHVKYRTGEIRPFLADGYLFQLLQDRVRQGSTCELTVHLPAVRMFRTSISAMSEYCLGNGISFPEELLKLKRESRFLEIPAHHLRNQYNKLLELNQLMPELMRVRKAMAAMEVEELRLTYELMGSYERKLREQLKLADNEVQAAFWFMARFYLRRILRERDAGILKDFKYRAEKRQRQIVETST